MAYPTAVNDQTTDSIAEAGVAVLGVVPAVATANLMSATSDALALAAHNATSAQQQMNTLASTATVVGVAILNSVKPKG